MRDVIDSQMGFSADEEAAYHYLNSRDAAATPELFRIAIEFDETKLFGFEEFYEAEPMSKQDADDMAEALNKNIGDASRHFFVVREDYSLYRF